VRDAIEMWRSTRMVVLTALSAAVYAAVLIPFKAIVIVPGLTELRPAAALPVVLSLLFGPAAAWGSALGNLIGDFFGTLGPGSFFGLIANFLYGYVPYRLWRMLAGDREATGAPGQLPLYWLVTVVAASACAVTVGFGVEILGLAPYAIVGTIVVINNTLVAGVLGAVLLPLLYPRAQRWGLLYTQNMPPTDVASGPLAPLGGVLLSVASIGGALIAVNVARGAEAGQLVPLLPASVSVVTVSGICFGLILLGTVLLARLPLWRVPHTAAATAGIRALTDMPIEAEGLRFTYPGQDHPALDGVSLTIQPGEWLTLAGATGAGKSTLCLCLSGIIPTLQQGQFEGSVRVFGHDTSGLAVHDIAERVGILFQDFESQLFCTDLQAEVAFALEQRGTPREDLRRRVHEALEVTGLTSLVERDPATLSGGEKQRLALAAVLAADPDVLVLDEPRTDLDPAGRAALVATLRALQARGKSLLVVENDLWPPTADEQLALLTGGHLAVYGPAPDLLADVGRCGELALRPLAIPDLFARVGSSRRPLMVDSALAALTDEPWQLDEDAWTEILNEDAAREQACGEVVVEIADLTHAYDEVEVLRGVSLTVRRREFVAILGPNGSGKTTLARHLNGLLRPTAGTVTVDGRSSVGTSTAQLARVVGYLFQDPDDQIFARRVDEEVAFGLHNLGYAESEIEQRVRESLEWVGLLEVREADPFTLTKGERQRVALASVLAVRPDIIVFDEPTTGLDGVEQEQMMRRLRRLNEAGHTVIIITHTTWAAAAYAHRVVLLRDGEIVADGPTRNIFADQALLQDAGQVAPEIVRFTQQAFRRTLLSVDEAARCLSVVGRRGTVA